ncbi:hypothetical protein F5Y05DRAFT_384466 [Hypoxylon sp. FL0543]|nr:hypothetical protein F5Y05DRAFT_384466 [Hypoxylon sp. FL0543]
MIPRTWYWRNAKFKGSLLLTLLAADGTGQRFVSTERFHFSLIEIATKSKPKTLQIEDTTTMSSGPGSVEACLRSALVQSNWRNDDGAVRL